MRAVVRSEAVLHARNPQATSDARDHARMRTARVSMGPHVADPRSMRTAPGNSNRGGEIRTLHDPLPVRIRTPPVPRQIHASAKRRVSHHAVRRAHGPGPRRSVLYFGAWFGARNRRGRFWK